MLDGNLLQILDEKFWVAAAFVIFIALVWKPLAKAVTGGLDKRSEKIKNELDEALRLKEEAQTVLALYQRKHAKAAEEAEEIIAHAKKEAERIVDSAKKKVEQEVTKRTELAIQKISQAEATVIQELRENAVDITVSAAKALIAENLGKETADELMGKAITDISRKFH